MIAMSTCWGVISFRFFQHFCQCSINHIPVFPLCSCTVSFFHAHTQIYWDAVTVQSIPVWLIKVLGCGFGCLPCRQMPSAALLCFTRLWLHPDVVRGGAVWLTECVAFEGYLCFRGHLDGYGRCSEWLLLLLLGLPSICFIKWQMSRVLSSSDVKSKNLIWRQRGWCIGHRKGCLYRERGFALQNTDTNSHYWFRLDVLGGVELSKLSVVEFLITLLWKPLSLNALWELY